MSDPEHSTDDRTIKDALIQYSRSFYQLLANRRKLDRWPISGTIAVTYKDAYGQLTMLQCNCVDISQRGIGVDCPELLMANLEAHLQSDEHNFSRFARVRYCVQHGTLFHVGLEFSAKPPNWN